jgi:hypothetical protein
MPFHGLPNKAKGKEIIMNDIGYKDVDAYVHTLVSDELEKQAEDIDTEEGSSEDAEPATAVSEAQLHTLPKFR